MVWPWSSRILLSLPSQHWDHRHVLLWPALCGDQGLNSGPQVWWWQGLSFKWGAVCRTYTAMTVMSLNGEYSKSVSVYVAQHHICSLLFTCDVLLGSTWLPCPRSRYRERTSVTGPKKLGMRVWRISIWLWISQGDQHRQVDSGSRPSGCKQSPRLQ